MAKITITPDCGNSPKMAFLRDFNIAFAEDDYQKILACVTEDVIWEMVGDWQAQGKTALAALFDTMGTGVVTEFTLHTLVTHGKHGAVNGELVLVDGKHYGFCDIYTFSSAAGKKLKSFLSYMILLE